MEYVSYIMTAVSLALLGYVIIGGWLTAKKSAIAATILVVVGLPLWGAYEYARPHFTVATINKTERVSTDDTRTLLTSAGEFNNQDTWWWLKKNSGSVQGDAAAVEGTGKEMVILSTGIRFEWTSTYPNAITVTDGYPILSFVWIIHQAAWLFAWLALIVTTRKIAGRSQKATI